VVVVVVVAEMVAGIGSSGSDTVKKKQNSKIRTLTNVALSAHLTPKCILFAKLPEPYGSECSGVGLGCGFKKIQLRRMAKKQSEGGKGKDKIKGKGKARVNLVDDESEKSSWDNEGDKEERGW
jgi:hypothetical protein